MAYSQEEIEEGYTAFFEARTINGAASLIGKPESTVYKWAQKYNWKERLEKDLEKIADDPFGETALATKKFDFTDEDEQTLRNIRSLEAICIVCIREKKIQHPDNNRIFIYENEMIENLGLKPRSFVEASNTLAKCWSTREAILSRNIMQKTKSGAIDNDDKEDWLGEQRKRIGK